MALEVKRIQLRRDTLADWTTANPILAEGEYGYETDTGYERIGDGATAFLSLTRRGPFLEADRTKLDGVEAGADVTDTTNVAAAGALMDSEVYDVAAVKAYYKVYDNYAAFKVSTEPSRGIGVIWDYGDGRGTEAVSGDISNSAGTPVQLNVLSGDDGSFNVKALGATGDGVTDDYAAILNAQNSGKHIVFPEGNYLIGTPLTTGNNEHWVGAQSSYLNANEATKIIYNGTDPYALTINDNTFVEGMTIYAPNTSGVFLRGVLPKFYGVIFGGDASGSIGVTFSDGTLTNPCYYGELMLGSKVKDFPKLLQMNRYANACTAAGIGNGLNLISGAITIDGGNFNKVSLSCEGTYVGLLTDPIIIFTGATCVFNKYDGYFEPQPVGSAKLKVSFGADTYGNVVDAGLFIRETECDFDQSASQNYVVPSIRHDGGGGEDTIYRITSPNLLDRANFPQSARNWVLSNCTFKQQTTTFKGLDVTEFDVPSGVNPYIQMTVPNIEKLRGRTITMSCWIARTSDVNITGPSVRFLVGPTPTQLQTSGNATDDTEFTWVQCSAIVPETGTYVNMRLSATGSATTSAWVIKVAGVTVVGGRMVQGTEVRPLYPQEVSMGPIGFALYTEATLTADVNSYDPVQSGILRMSSDASRTITGIVLGFEGQQLTFINVGANNIVLANQSASSTALNRIITGTGANLTIAPDQSVMMTYDNQSGRWRVIAKN